MKKIQNKVDLNNKRDKGQFWTPHWVAKAMVAYVQRGSNLVFDLGVGKGAFYTALKEISPRKKYIGIDSDPTIIRQARDEGVFGRDATIEIRDFILDPPKKLFKAIISNPPYIRHHRISRKVKNQLRVISSRNLGYILDGRAGLHIYFLIQALSLLDRGGRLAFIMPADTCEGVFSSKLWSWISRKYCIDGVVTFDYNATPFPGVDTNAVIFLIRNAKPKKTLIWAKCLLPQNEELYDFFHSDLAGKSYKNIKIYERNLNEALVTGFTRLPRKNSDFEFTLADFAHVMRGIATGANEFFFLTKEKANDIGIPDNFLLPAIGRTRDSDGPYLTKETLKKLEGKGRPSLLFSPNSSQWEDMPLSVKKYIHEGERLGLSKRSLISTRKPWYKMEVRKVPVFLFAYLGRRNVRFIKNNAGAVPLTGFLCVYPHLTDKDSIEKLWTILQHPDTVSNLHLVGKSYGFGAIKVEPRSLEKLPIPFSVVERARLSPAPRQESIIFSPITAGV